MVCTTDGCCSGSRCRGSAPRKAVPCGGSSDFRVWKLRAPASLALGFALCSGGCFGGAAADVDAQLRSQWFAQLQNRTPLTAPERAARAQSILSDERFERLEDVHQKALEATWRVALRASPQRIFSGIRHVGKAAWRLRKRGSAEDDALAWLEPGVESQHDTAGSALYLKLRDRERGELAAKAREDARDAMDRNRFVCAEQDLAHALALEPDEADATLELYDDLEERQRTSRLLEPRLTSSLESSSPSERMLAQDYRSFLSDESAANSEQSFARGAAALLLREPDVARSEFARLSESSDVVGAMASNWLDRPEVDVQGEFERAVSVYRWKRLLGWIGGNALAERGTSVSVWKDSLTMANMGVSLPARVLRGWKPDPSAVQASAVRYLAAQPRGPLAKDAREWLGQVGWPEADEPLSIAEFIARPTDSRRPSLRLDPVIVSRDAVLSAQMRRSSAVASALEGSRGVRFEVRQVTRPQRLQDELEAPGFPLPARPARLLVDELASGIEHGSYRWLGSSEDEALERLRRFDGAIAAGWVLYAQSWNPETPGSWESFKATLIEGTDSAGSVAFERGEDDILAVHPLGSEISPCPKGVLCIEPQAPVQTAFYAYMDAGAGVGFGFQSVTNWIGTGLSLTTRGPELQLVLPIGRWFGLEEWLPIEAQLILGAEPYVGPVLRKQKCIEGVSEGAQASARKLLPLGLRSRCVLRLY